MLPDIIEEFSISIDNELDIAHWKKEHNLIKVATASIESNITDPTKRLYSVQPVEGQKIEYKTEQDLVYFLVFDGKIVKVGGTYTGLKKRVQSYYCGTRDNRERGTCSVTNYHVSEAIYAALVANQVVEFYIFKIPQVHITRLILGIEQEITCTIYPAYEKSFIELYHQLVGHNPLLSKNKAA